MKPRFRLLADGLDVTALIRDRLRVLTVTDEAGLEADALEITLDDRGSRLELPETGATLDLSLGAADALVELGRYQVDEVSGSSPAAEITIRAAAADMTGAIRAPRTRAWEGVSVAQIAGSIAARHNLAANVDATLGARPIVYIAQTEESDLHFLTRLVAPHGGLAKVSGGRLIITRRGAAETTEGAALVAPIIRGDQCSRFDWTIARREDVARATANWHDQAAGEQKSVTAGAGDPAMNIRHVFSTKADAQRAAQAAVDKGTRRGMTLTADLATFRADLFAECPIELLGARVGIDGRWSVTRVEHTFRGGLTTRIEAERSMT